MMKEGYNGRKNEKKLCLSSLMQNSAVTRTDDRKSCENLTDI
jgi:hypothetical protein